MADGRISYSVGLDNTKLRTDAAETRTILQGISSSAIQEGQRMEDSFSNIGKTIAGALSAAAAMSFLNQIKNVRAEIQSLEISFTTLLGSQAKAQSLFGEIRKFAVETPMMLKDLASGAQTMLGFGIAAEEIMPILKAIGDVSMGDSQKFQSLTLSFSQATAAGKLMGGDLLQMINAGFNPLAQIAERTGKSIATLKDEMSEGKISAEMLKQAFIDATSEGGKFNGMLEQQSKGINGAISNLYGAIDDMFNDIGTKLEKPFVDMTLLATELVKHYEEIAKVLAAVVAAYGTYKAALIAVVAYQKGLAIWGQVQAFLSLTKSIKSAKDAMLLLNMVTKANPIGLLLSAVAAAATAFALFSDSADEAAESLNKEAEEAEEFNRRVSESAGKAQSEYAKLQKEYKACKTEHQKTEWIRNSQSKFKELGISVNSVNTAENVFIKNTKLMLEAFKKRAEAAAWQSKVEDEYAKRVERQLQLEQQKDKIQAGSKVYGSSHTTEGGNEYVNNQGEWVYTEQGAARARAAIDQSIKNDPVIAAIDAKIDQYSKKVATLSTEMESLYKKAGNDPELTDEQKKAAQKAAEEQQKLADAHAKREEQIQANIESEKELIRKGELDIQQAKINAMEEGVDKELAQNKLNYDRLMAENEKRRDEMLKTLEDTKVLEWKQKNPKATDEQEIKYRASLNLTAADLSSSQRAQLDEFARIAAEAFEQANQKSLDKMLQDVMTYEQKRAQITEQYAKMRENLEYSHDETGARTGKREGVSQGNLDELDRQRDEALLAIDEEFASRQESYQAWMDSVANMTLEQLNQVLEQAKQELDAMEKDGTGGTALAQARAKVANTQKAISKASAKKELSPDKRTLKDWKELYDVLQEGVKGFEEIGDAVGGTAGEMMKAAGQIATGALSMINGIMTLVQSSAAGMQATATAGAAAMSTVEKASVILAVISAALQIATAIAGMFNQDDQKQEEIEALQGRIDQLQWELDNADVVRLRENAFSAIDKVKESLAATRMELLKTNYETKNWQGVIGAIYGTVRTNNELLTESAKKVADAYAGIAYSANKALGQERYDNAREDLENIAKQQLLMQEQIRQEQDKKDSDQGAIQDYQNKIEELGNQAVEIINTMVEDIIGGSAADIAQQLGDAFFEAFQNGEDAAKAWGDTVNDIVADIMKRMLIQKFLEEPLGEIFDKYKQKWFPNGIGANAIDSVLSSLGDFQNDLQNVGDTFMDMWEQMPEDFKNLLAPVEDAAREASEKGIATASQESVDELNGRATAIQGHTYSIMENTKLLVANTNAILASVMNIDRNTDSMNERLQSMEGNVQELKDTVNDIALKGIKMK